MEDQASSPSLTVLMYRSCRCRDRLFHQVPDSDADELGVVVVGGQSVRAASLALELSISQITGAARPALGCKMSPRLAQRGCQLVITLVREVKAMQGSDHTFLTPMQNMTVLSERVHFCSRSDLVR